MEKSEGQSSEQNRNFRAPKRGETGNKTEFGLPTGYIGSMSDRELIHFMEFLTPILKSLNAKAKESEQFDKKK
jgi:hypothetical protein